MTGISEVTLQNGTTIRCVEPPVRPDFWILMAEGEWERHTVDALTYLTGPGRVFVDIGGWVGPTAFVAAGRGAAVHSFEPDPVALEMFRRNLVLNPELADRITLHDYALGVRSGQAMLATSSLGDSESSLVKHQGEQVAVEVRSIREIGTEPWFANAAVVKLDVEGGEYQIMADLAAILHRRKPYFLLSTHTKYLSDRSSGPPDQLDRAAKARLLTHSRLVWQLRFYRYWYVPEQGLWHQVGRLRAARNLTERRDQEFLLSASPLPRRLLSSRGPGRPRPG